MKQGQKRYYLQVLYQKNRILFVGVCLFFILHINANFWFGGQQTPFFFWSLYSAPVADQKEYTTLEVRVNQDKLILFPHTWRQPQRLLYQHQLSQYHTMMTHQQDPLKNYIDNWNSNYPLFANIFPGLKFYNDSTEVQQFSEWYVKKIEQLTGEKVHTLEIFKLTLKYTEDSHVEKVSGERLYKLK